MARRLGRRAYADMYGPTTGDRVRLGDTALEVVVEEDATLYGEECKFGGGKVLRDGMGQAAGATGEEALDLLITNALVIDHGGIRKADAASRGAASSGSARPATPTSCRPSMPGWSPG